MKQNAIHYNMYCLLCNMQPRSVYSYWPGEKGALDHVIAVQLHNVVVYTNGQCTSLEQDRHIT